MKQDKKLKKKEKILNNRQDSLPKNGNSDDGGLAEVKKEKKSKKVKAEVIHIDDVSRDGNSENEEEKKKKKKKNRPVSESLNYSNGSDVKNDRKLCKKKQLDDSDNQMDTAHGSKKDRQPTKKRKSKNKSEQIESENVQTYEKEVSPGDQDKLYKKVKKEKQVNVFVSKEETEGQSKKKKTTNEETTDTVAETRVKKKKNRPKMQVAENDVKTETSAEKTGEVNEIKKKQRKKRKKEGEKEETAQIKDDTVNMEKVDATECGIAIIEEEETKPKKKKRIKQNFKGVEEELFSNQCEEVEEQNRKTLVKGALDSTTKKRRKVSTEIQTQVENVNSANGSKKKIKEKVEDNNAESPQMDTDLPPEKSTNTDPVTIKEGFGQWSTAQFESSDKQQKFLRLMGGFKKSFQTAAGNNGKANMALGQGAQQQLQQGLLGEFERAQSRRLDLSNRGAGLGFSAPSNKKFSINIDARRSVHFDE